MLFNSMEFLIFFPIAVLLYFAVPDKLKNYWLLAASYYFYMCWNARYVLLMLFSTAVTYTGALHRKRIKKRVEESGSGSLHCSEPGSAVFI